MIGIDYVRSYTTNPPTTLIVLSRGGGCFLYKGLTFLPQYKTENRISFSCMYDNFRISLDTDRLYFQGSLHKFCKGENYSQFTFFELIEAIKRIDEKFEGSFSNSKITLLEYGINLKLDYNPANEYSSWEMYSSKEVTKMIHHGKVYGSKFYLSQHTIKGYDKTFESKLSDQNVLRIECMVKGAYLQSTKRLHSIRCITDLLSLNNLQLLNEDLKMKYKKIIRDTIKYEDLDKLSVTELKIISAMRDSVVEKLLKKKYKETYKKNRRTYLKVVKESQKTNEGIYPLLQSEELESVKREKTEESDSIKKRWQK
ncbi:hypothetical protein EI427_05630 [Flammeovirga pectinis]|uniref:Uncharacterized protein n=1 Tax=Flammeovirga pectinis TaxID=2494373 RepID=A0A3Q9FMN7_9BACT|nr:hypothetical protein [Flammeovirga pectinis]AZQ61732.1 hypothetical protein EI427_05630 [Flammeovirga pectinis]